MHIVLGSFDSGSMARQEPMVAWHVVEATHLTMNRKHREREEGTGDQD
jgi:hypothetical protein